MFRKFTTTKEAGAQAEALASAIKTVAQIKGLSIISLVAAFDEKDQLATHSAISIPQDEKLSKILALEMIKSLNKMLRQSKDPKIFKAIEEILKDNPLNDEKE